MSKTTASRSAIGGAANEGGAEFRAGVATLLSVHMLRGWPLEELEFPAEAAVPTTVELETDDAVDDISSALNGSGRAYVQAKRDLGLTVMSERPASLRGGHPLADTRSESRPRRP